MAACVSAMDEGVGKVLAALKRNQLEQDTLVLFTSDNGPLLGAGGSVGELRGGKHSLWEGGIRVPAIVRWPSKLPAGVVFDLPVVTHDIFPTCLEALGVPIPREVTLDGQSLLAQWQHQSPRAAAVDAPRTHCWSYVRDSTNTRESAVRRGSWKWLNGELYNLQSDPGETTNVKAKHPEVASELESTWKNWLAQFPLETKRWNGRNPQRQVIQRRPTSAKSP